jgi:hypothetical protein
MTEPVVFATMTSHSHPSPKPARRSLVQRRGSVSASDPFGNHAALNHNPNLSTSSTLTIVRVDPQTQQSGQPVAQDSASNTQHRSRFHRRVSSTGSSSAQNLPRLSFAFSSFASHAPATGGPASPGATGVRPASPTSPLMRPSSPSSSRHPSHRSFNNKPRLTPAELYDLAKHSVSPKFANSSAPSSPPGSSPNTSSADAGMAPAVFTALPPSVYLPFLDRSAEVASLISSPPTTKLFALLQQMFPKDPSSSAHSPLLSGSVPENEIPSDPLTWSFTHLTSWLLLPRSAAPDALYVLKTRHCILSRSELIWERVKGALGVPPELDTASLVEVLDWRSTQVSVHGYGDSAIDSEDESVSASEKGGESEKFRMELTSPGSTGRQGSITRLSIPSGATGVESSNTQWREVPEATTPLSESPFPSEADPHTPIQGPGQISISPILTPSSSQSLNPPHLSLAASEGEALGDITEDAEGEDESANAGDAKANVEAAPLTPEQSPQIQGLRIHTTPLPASAQIDLSAFPSPRSFTPSRPGSVASFYGSRPTSRAGSFKSHSRPGSVSHSPTFSARPASFSATGSPVMGRSGSFGASSPSTPYRSSSVAFARSSSFGSLSGLAFSYGRSGPAERREAGSLGGDEEGNGADRKGNEAAMADQVIVDRTPGNIQTRSSLARLATGSTLITR